ncbi:MAG: ABC transporter permease [Clostridia bacterium]|nr:ABC transporter permease [Clostridia bacterium]
MKSFWTIVKKELSRFFHDKRLLMALFLPGILIYAVYSLIGGGLIDSLTAVDEDYSYKLYTLNAPAGFAEELGLDDERWKIVEIEADEAEKIKTKIEEQEADLYLEFTPAFEFSGGEGTGIAVYYNTAKTESSAAYGLIGALISAKQFDSPKFTTLPFDLVKDEDMTAMLFSSIGPMLVLVFLFSGCASIAPESIAGEKERGTFATMLVTPVKRSYIALGKIVSLSILSVLSGFCSFLGLTLSLPKLMGDLGGSGLSAYGFGDYMMLLGVVISSVLLIVAIISVVSTLANSVKEATSMVGPLTLVVVVMGVATMFGGGGEWYWHLIPIYNSALAMSDVFSLSGSALNVLVTIGANLLYATGLSLLLAKMFDSEKIVSGS